ncbi:hypothetical protein [Acinetobacter venetianus]|uniref:hypothetical protein n=1 Tax=Acinetobacter venetianus TaxID=52133 RepID=UPI003A8D973E
MNKQNKDKSTHVWATYENGLIISISEPSGKPLKITSRNTVLYKGEEYFFYGTAVLDPKI